MAGWSGPMSRHFTFHFQQFRIILWQRCFAGKIEDSNQASGHAALGKNFAICSLKIGHIIEHINCRYILYITGQFHNDILTFGSAFSSDFSP